MNETAVEIGSEELAMRPVKGDVADAGSAVRVDIGKQGHGTGDTVDFPDRTGSAAILLAELPIHEARAGFAAALPFGPPVLVLVFRDDLEAVHGRGRGIEVRHDGRGLFPSAVIIGKSEHLADFGGRHFEGRRRKDHLPAGRGAEPGHVEDAQRGALGVDEGFVHRVHAGQETFLETGNERAGKTGHGHETWLDDRILLRARGCMC